MYSLSYQGVADYPRILFLFVCFLQSHVCVSRLTEMQASDWINGTGGEFLLQIWRVAGDQIPSRRDYLRW